MGTVRINFHDGDYGTRLFNDLMQAFHTDTGRWPSHYDGYYEKLETWQSELTEWISNQGCPCRGWQDRRMTGDWILRKSYPTGIELENPMSIWFLMRWL